MGRRLSGEETKDVAVERHKMEMEEDEGRNKTLSGRTSVAKDFAESKLYRQFRDRNNESCRRSRVNRKRKEGNLMDEKRDLERRNETLRQQIVNIEKLKSKIQLKLNKILLKQDPI